MLLARGIASGGGARGGVDRRARARKWDSGQESEGAGGYNSEAQEKPALFFDSQQAHTAVQKTLKVDEQTAWDLLERYAR